MNCPQYGIEESNLDELKEKLQIQTNDAFLLFATPSEKASTIVDQIIMRMIDIEKNGIPKDTRLATPNGETKFLRPRPGAARMYPETDIPPIIISKNEIENARKKIPKSWDESIKELETKYHLNNQLSEQIFDSKYGSLFEKILNNSKVNPTFVASILCSSITNLERNGLNSNLLHDEEIEKAFEFLEKGKIAKESLEIIFENIMSGKSVSIEDAMKNTSIETINESELETIIHNIITKNEQLIINQKQRAIGPLMGMAMKELRGKVSGETVNKLLQKGHTRKTSSRINAGSGI